MGGKHIALNRKNLSIIMSSASAQEAQIAALIQCLEEAKEAECWENEHKEAERKEVEAATERARLEEERRVQEEREA